MEVVIDQQGLRREHGKELLEETPGKGGDIQQVFRGKEGERLSLMNKLAAGQSEVVEEGGYILVTLVNLVPDAGELPGIQVVGNQGGLAASGRSRQPECRALQGLVEPAE